MVASADGTALTPPITQDWANTGLITADDNWSGVPGIIGYRGDSLTSSPGSDPQLTVADGSSTPVDVNANRNDPDTFISGGVSEFELVNPVVALNGSGTADAPHLVVHVNSTGFSGINVAYNLRDLDGSADNSVQAVALQYRVGGSGNYVNVPLGFVADATTGPSQATLVTPVSVTLPAACDNQPLVQIRIISNDAVGNDEWVGVDDINITAGGGGGGVISGSGAANPTTAAPGAATLLTVTVNPATTPPSTGIAVVGNLTPIAGSSTQTFFDDGSNGDVTGGDNIFSFLATVGAAVPTGQKTIVATITDAQLRTANALITLTVQVPPSSDDHITMGNPSGATADIGTPLNYLMTKPQYILSYNRDDGRPNWVSWHLDTTWLGSAPRQDDFRPDTSLPAGWYQVLQTDYSGSGFDRGHHTPSADRTSSIPDNSATFFMTNMMPQAPDNNQGPWEQLESYSRTLVNAGNELYIIMGGAGIGGTGSNGPATTVANGHVTVPARTWKVIIVLPVGNNDVSRVNKNTRVIAVNMPNTQGIRTMDWRTFRVSVDSLEALTTYNFFSNVSVMTQSAIEKRADIVP
jgi:endonuclease G